MSLKYTYNPQNDSYHQPQVNHQILAQDFTKTADTTLEAVPTLEFYIAPWDRWEYDVYLYFLCDTTGDGKVRLDFDQTPTTFFEHVTRFTGGGGGQQIIYNTPTTRVLNASGDGLCYARLDGFIVNGATAGTAYIQFAQNTASGSSTLYAGSHIITTRF